MENIRTLQLSAIFCFFLFYGCGRETGVPLSLYFTDQEQQDAAAIPAKTPELVLTQVAMVASDAPKRRITIKLLQADADAFEKLTTRNIGKTLIIVQGSKVLTTPKILETISARAGMTFTVSTNLDFESVDRELFKLSK